MEYDSCTLALSLSFWVPGWTPTMRSYRPTRAIPQCQSFRRGGSQSPGRVASGTSAPRLSQFLDTPPASRSKKWLSPWSLVNKGYWVWPAEEARRCQLAPALTG